MRKKILAAALAGLLFVSNFSSVPLTVNAEEFAENFSEENEKLEVVDEAKLVEDEGEPDTDEKLVEDTFVESPSIDEETSEESDDDSKVEESDTTENVSEEEDAEEEVVEEVSGPEEMQPEQGENDDIVDADELEEVEEALLTENVEEELESNGDVDINTRNVILVYNPVDISVEAHIGNMACTGENFGDYQGIQRMIAYSVGKDQNLSFTMSASENCKINKIMTADLEDDDSKEKVITPGNKTYTEYAIAADGKGYIVFIESVATLKATMSQNGTEVKPVGGLYNFAFNTSYGLTLTRGKQDTALKMISVVDTSDKTKKNILSELVANKSVTETGTFKFGKAYAGKKFDMTAVIYPNTEFQQEYRFKVAVANTLTSVTVAGEKNGTITVDDARVKKFKLSMNKGANLSELVIAVKGSDKYENSTAKIEDGYLVVSGPVKYDNETTKNETLIQFKNSSNEIIHETKVVVNPTFKKLVPSISYVSSNDTDITVKLGLPKGMTISDFSKDIYYVVEYTDENNVKTTCSAIKATDLTQNHTFKMFNVAAGQGKKASFKATAKLIVAKDSFTLESATSKVATLNTKAPAYETKLTLVKKTSVVMAGKKTLLAEVKYSNNTTFTQIQSAYIQGPDGKYTAVVEDNKIYASFGSYVSSGKYKLTVTSNAKDSSCVGATASIDFTVRGQVYGGFFEKYNSDLKSFDIYKKPNQAYSIQLKLRTYDYSKNKVTPGAVEYKLIGTDGKEIDPNSYLAKKVKVTNKGVLTIAKDYYLSSDKPVSFRVRAEFDPGEKTSNIIDSCLFNINAKETTISDIKLVLASGKTISDGDSVSADQLKKAAIVCYDGSNALNNGEFSVTASGSALKIVNQNYKCSIIDVKKTGNIKITAKALDGGKGTKSINVKVTGSENQLSLNISYVNSKDGVYENPDMDAYLIVEGVSEISSLDKFKVECKKGRIVSMKPYLGIMEGYLKYIQNTVSDGEFQYGKNMFEMDAYTEFVYIPRSSSDAITLTNLTTGEKKEYAIHNQIFDMPKFEGTIDATNAVLYSYQRADVSYTIKNYNFNKDSKYEVSVDVDVEAALKDMRNYTNISGETKYRSVDMTSGEFNVELYDWVDGGSKATKPGKYLLYIDIRETKADGTVINYKPVSTFVTLKKKPTPTVNPPKTITIGYQAGSQVKLPDMKGVIDFNLALGNSNKGGNYNQFVNYFSVEKKSDGYVLKVKKDLTGVDINNLEGYLRYSYRDFDYVINNKDIKVNIKVTKPVVKK